MYFNGKFRPKRTVVLVCLFLLAFSAFSYTREPAPFDISIESAEDVIPGIDQTIAVICNAASEEITGFDFVIALESANLRFIEAVPGEFFDRCGWQYFTYRYYDNDGNVTNVTTDLIHLTAAAADAEPGDPDCYLPEAGESLALLTIRTPPGCRYRCRYLPIRFFWSDCHDNNLILRSDGSLAISRFVYDGYGEDITDIGSSLPSVGGAPDSCIDAEPPAESRLVDFHNGYLMTICPDEICIERGDINCDDIPYQAADVVYMINMFIIIMMNPEVWPPWDECSFINSDVNADGMQLSVADLVYLIRVIVGDALPYPKPEPMDQTIDILSRSTVSGAEIRYRSPVDIGGVWLRCRFDNSADAPVLAPEISDMQMEYRISGDYLGMLIYNKNGDAIRAGDDLLATIPTTGSMSLIDVEAADRFGRLLRVNTESVPGRFEVSQNHPNPFNPSTEIILSLPASSEWRLTVFNILGQTVREFYGYDEAGQIPVIWDGCDRAGSRVAGGIYFYKATVGQESITRKMVLLK